MAKQLWLSLGFFSVKQNIVQDILQGIGSFHEVVLRYSFKGILFIPAIHVRQLLVFCFSAENHASLHCLFGFRHSQ